MFDYVTTKEYLVESEAVMFLKQIMVALDYLHSKNICHLDMKVKPALLSYVIAVKMNWQGAGWVFSLPVKVKLAISLLSM